MRTSAHESTAAFEALIPTRIVGGIGCVKQVSSWVSMYGRRVLVVLGESHVRDTGLWEKLSKQLSSEGLVVEVLEGVPTNPTVSIVDAGASLARSAQCDVILACGGGSVIDVAKAISIAVYSDRTSFRDYLSGCRVEGVMVQNTVPVVALPTLPGSGSETNGTSVITDDMTGGKWSAHSDLAAPRVALLDPELAMFAPPDLLGLGLLDSVCHALEAGCSARANVSSDALAEQAIRTTMRYLKAACENDWNDASRLVALQHCWWASTLASQALSWAGSIVTHPLAHAVSSLTGARHADAVISLEASSLVELSSRLEDTGVLLKVAQWFDVKKSKDTAVLLRGVLNRLAQLSKSAGAVKSLADLGVTSDDTAQIVSLALSSGSRGITNVPGGEPSNAELKRIVDKALRFSPTATAAQWLSS